MSMEFNKWYDANNFMPEHFLEPFEASDEASIARDLFALILAEGDGKDPEAYQSLEYLVVDRKWAGGSDFIWTDIDPESETILYWMAPKTPLGG